VSPTSDALCGILLLDKPLGLSSNAALQRVRWLLGRPKAGHTGSLDPLATGMLPICIGEATKLAGELLAGRKGYTFEVRLGTRTDTADAEGQVVEERPIPLLSQELIHTALAPMRGPQWQVPPMYSALKRDGEPLYRLARRGETVERAARAIEIYSLELLDSSPSTLRLRVECSKGTYVRVLAEQLAGNLDTCGHVCALRRDFVEPFRDQPMQSLAELEVPGARPRLLGADLGASHLPAVRLDEGAARAMGFGQTVQSGPGAEGAVRLYDPQGRFLGLGERIASGTVRPRRLFARPRDAGATLES
jgi:tRNA pseudouridine55 synthase